MTVAVGVALPLMWRSNSFVSVFGKVSSRRCVAVTLSVLIAVSATGVVGERSLTSDQASVGTPDGTARLIASVAPSQGAVVLPQVVGERIQAAIPLGVLSIPPSLYEPLVLTSETGAPWATVSLPGSDGGSSAHIASDGSAIYTSPESGADVAVQVLDSGGVRVQTVVKGPGSAKSFSYDFGPGVTLVLTEAGGVELRREANDTIESIGYLAPPWARDATGQSVSTWYAVHGSVVTQHVSPAVHHRYPIVADPFWIPVLSVMARFTAHALQRMALRKVSQEQVKQVVLNGSRRPGNEPGTSVFSQGSGKAKIRVVVNDKTGAIITVTRG